MNPYIKKLYKQKFNILIKIKRYQDNCKHPNVIKEHKGNTGNYDPSNDRYWIECECPDCDKRWSENYKN